MSRWATSRMALRFPAYSSSLTMRAMIAPLSDKAAHQVLSVLHPYISSAIAFHTERASQHLDVSRNLTDIRRLAPDRPCSQRHSRRTFSSFSNLVPMLFPYRKRRRKGGTTYNKKNMETISLRYT